MAEHTEGGLCQTGCHCDMRGDGDELVDCIGAEPATDVESSRFGRLPDN